MGSDNDVIKRRPLGLVAVFMDGFDEVGVFREMVFSTGKQSVYKGAVRRGVVLVGCGRLLITERSMLVAFNAAVNGWL